MSTNNVSKPNNATALQQVQALIAGTEKHFPSTTFTLGNASYTTAMLVQTLQGLEQALAGLATAHKSLADAVTTLKGTQTSTGPLVRAYRRYVLAAFGTATQQLGDFGLQAPKARPPMTTEQRVAATAKLRATRAARGTTSRKQKLAVKGDVTGVIVTPVTGAKASDGSPSAAQPQATPTSASAPAVALPANPVAASMAVTTATRTS